MDLKSFFDVSIDFDTSHTIFPVIVSTVLAVLFVVILVTNYKAMVQGLSAGRGWTGRIDSLRLLGTIILVSIYFWAMEWIGLFFPNQGLGFLFSTIIFVFAISLLYMHEKRSRKIIIAALNAIITPLCVWFILSNLFNISLP